MKELSPMMTQYFAIKEANKDLTAESVPAYPIVLNEYGSIAVKKVA